MKDEKLLLMTRAEEGEENYEDEGRKDEREKRGKKKQ